jgi:hypothetical protein
VSLAPPSKIIMADNMAIAPAPTETSLVHRDDFAELASFLLTVKVRAEALLFPATPTPGQACRRPLARPSPCR